MNTGQKPRLIVGISGSSGLPYGTRLLEVLRKLATHEVHLILTDAAKLNISVETDWRVKDVEALADVLRKHRQRLLPHRRDDRRALLDSNAFGDHPLLCR